MEREERGHIMEQERRKAKRRDMKMVISIKTIVDNPPRKVPVELEDLSKAGIGFHSMEDFGLHDVYEAEVVTWKKELINTLVKIVRKEQLNDGNWRYGGIFIGMTETDAFRIESAGMFQDAGM